MTSHKSFRIMTVLKKLTIHFKLNLFRMQQKNRHQIIRCLKPWPALLLPFHFHSFLEPVNVPQLPLLLLPPNLSPCKWNLCLMSRRTSVESAFLRGQQILKILSLIQLEEKRLRYKIFSIESE